MSAFTMGQDKSDTAVQPEDVAAQLAGEAAPTIKKKRGRPAKKQKTSSANNDVAATARSLAEEAKTEAQRAEQACQKAKKALKQQTDVVDKLIHSADPTDAAKVSKAQQDMKAAGLQHDRTVHAMKAAEGKFKGLDMAATTLEALLDH